MIKSVISIIGVACALTPCAAGFSLKTDSPDARYGANFQGGTLQYREDRTVYYSTDNVVDYENPYGVSEFIPSLPNSCVVESAGNAIVYYDRLYDELVPDYRFKYNSRGEFSYGRQNEGVDNMYKDLSAKMGYNKDGVTIDGFKSGIKSYVSSKGRTATLTKATGSYHNINYDYLVRQLEQEKVAVVFLNGCAVVHIDLGISRQEGYDVIHNVVMSGHHSMLVYGYKDIYYYDASGKLIDRNTYLYAEDGYGDFSYLVVDRYTTVDDIYILDIN